MSRRGWVLFALMGVLWGVPYLMIKVAVVEVSVPVLVFARTALGALVLLPLAIRGGRLGELRKRWKPLLAFAVIEIIVPWALLSDAELRITSSLTGLLIAGSPIVAVLVAKAAGDRERLGLVRWAGLGLGLVGVALLAGPGLAGGNPWSIVEVLIVAVCYATAPQIAARKLADVSGLQMTAVCLAFAALVYVIPAVLTWPAATPSVPALASIVGLGLVSTALAFVVFFALIREVGASRAVVFTYVNPAVAVVAGMLVLGEPLTAAMAAAFALILAGSLLATRTRTRPPRVAVPSGAGQDVA